MCIMKCHLHLLWRGPEYETCVLLQQFSLGLLIFLLLLLHNEGVHKYEGKSFSPEGSMTGNP